MLRHIVTALHGWALRDREIPTLEIRVQSPIDALPLVARNPRPGGDVRGGPVFLDSFRGRDKWNPAV